MLAWARARGVHSTGRLLHSSHLLLSGEKKKALFVSGQVICTQWEAEISFPHEISE